MDRYIDTFGSCRYIDLMDEYYLYPSLSLNLSIQISIYRYIYGKKKKFHTTEKGLEQGPTIFLSKIRRKHAD